MDKKQSRYVNDIEAAEIMGLSKSTLRNWRCKGIGPEHIKLSNRCVRYKLETIEQYMSRHKVIPYKELDGSE